MSGMNVPSYIALLTQSDDQDIVTQSSDQDVISITQFAGSCLQYTKKCAHVNSQHDYIHVTKHT